MSQTQDSTSNAVPSWRKWLHRIGYVTTTFFVLLLCFVAYQFAKIKIEDSRREAEQVAESQTTAGPLRKNAREEWVRPILIGHLAELTPLNELNGNGFRFVAMPSFDGAAYAFSLSLKPGAAQAEGQLHVITRVRETGTENAVQLLDIEAPRNEVEAFFRRIDALTRNYPGEGGYGCLDGTSVGYERVVGATIWSGEGNCEPVYRNLKNAVQAFVQAHVDSPLVPTQEGWSHAFDRQP